MTHSESETARHCTSSDPLREAYERDGYVVVKDIVPRAEALALAERAARLADRGSDGDVTPSQVQTFFVRGGARRMVKLSQLCRTEPRFGELAHRTALVDVVERLAGAGARLFRDVVVMKPARTGGKLSFHQDSAYWDVEPKRLVSAWVALTDAPVEASCLEVRPGSHRAQVPHGLVLRDRIRVPARITAALRGLVSRAGTGDNPGAAGGNASLWRLKTLVLARASRYAPVFGDLQDFRALPEGLTGSVAKPLPVAAGDAIFFHSLLLHASGPNTASADRYAHIISYMPADARFVGVGDTDFPPARSDP